MAKATKKRVIDDVEEELSAHEESPQAKKSKGAKSAAGEGVDGEGNRYWEVIMMTLISCPHQRGCSY